MNQWIYLAAWLDLIMGGLVLLYYQWLLQSISRWINAVYAFFRTVHIIAE